MIVTANDQDQGLNHGTIRYSIIAGNGPGCFSIHSATGLITVTPVGLDREAADTHTLTVQACDDVAGSASERCVSTTVTVLVNDVNDNAPVCVPDFYQVSFDLKWI